MSRSGLAFPNVVDFVTRRDDEFVLYLVEDRRLEDHDALALQEKLNTYLSFAVDGPLLERFPEASGHPVAFRLELRGGMSPFVVEFLRRFASGLVAHGIQLAVVAEDAPVS